MMFEELSKAVSLAVANAKAMGTNQAILSDVEINLHFWVSVLRRAANRSATLPNPQREVK